MEKNIENLKKLRLILGIKQQDFAKAIDYTQSHYCNIENKRLLPSDETIRNMYNKAKEVYEEAISAKYAELNEQLDILEI